MSESLLFDETIELCDPGAIHTTGEYWFEALAEGASFGEPQPAQVAVQSLLRDGAITRTERDDNREQTFLVTVCSSSSAGVASGVARLHRATAKATTLKWTPPDGYGATTVFDVLTSSLHNPGDFDDLELMRNRQTYQLRLVCLPYARSTLTMLGTDPNPPMSSIGATVLENCETVARWSTWDENYPQFAGFAVDAVNYVEGAGAMRSTMTQWDPGFLYGPANNGYYLSPAAGISRDQITGLALATSAGGFMAVAIRGEIGNTTELVSVWTSTSNGPWVASPPFTAVERKANGFVYYVWPLAASVVITGLRFLVKQSVSGHGVPRPSTWYDQIERRPTVAANYQITKQFEVLGSARAQGSLHIASPLETTALGQVLAITVPTAEIPAGFQPDGRRWVTQGTTTPDVSAIGGSYYTPSTAYSAAATFPIFDVPVGVLATGPYVAVALVKTAGTPLVTGVQAQLMTAASVAVSPAAATEVSIPNTYTGWQFVPCGTIYLPPLPIQAADVGMKVRLLFKGATLADVYLIPAWQLDGYAVADFSIVDCGSAVVAPGGSSSHLWVNSPSIGEPQGGIWRGPTLNRANLQSAWPDAKKPGLHVFNPGGLTAFLVTTVAKGATLDLEYSPSWFGMAAI